MRIAFVSDAIYPYNVGGKEKRLYELSRRLAKKGHEVHIFTMQWWTGPKTIDQDGIKIHAISRKYNIYAGKRRSIFQAIMYGISCLGIIRYGRFDVIDVDHIPFFPLITTKIVALFSRAKLYATWHEVWGKEYWNKYLGSYGIVGSIVERLSASMPNAIVSNSKLTTEQLVNQFSYKKPIYTIFPGVDSKHIGSLKPAAKSYDLIYSGRLLDNKHVDYLVEAVALLVPIYPDISCLIIGEGPELRDIKSQVKKLSLDKHVKIRPFIPNPDTLYSLIKSASVLIQPSTREGFGIIAIEANAAGVPVITTDDYTNATRLLIKNEVNGLLYTSSALNLAGAIKKTLGPEPLFKDVDTIVQIARSYNWEFAAEKLEQAYQS